MQMLRWFRPLIVLCALVTAALGPNIGLAPGRQADDTFEGLKAEAEAARKNLVQEYQRKVQDILDAHERAVREAKTDQEKAKASAMPALPMFNTAVGLESFSPRFLAWSNAHPDDARSFDAAIQALETSGRLAGDPQAFEAALVTLKTRFATEPRIRPVLKSLGRQHLAAAEELLREVGARHPDRQTQALAFKALANSLRAGVALAEAAQGANQKAVSSRFSQTYLDAEIAGIDRNRREAKTLDQLLARSYADVLPDLAIGRPAPEVISSSVDGHPTRLSELKGKVVVLDIWATWCGPCVAMIPHQREMVQRLKDRPFVLVSISADEQRETLQEFLQKEDMPWPQWWSGRESGIVLDWDIEQYPTTYIIDRDGRIRFKDLRGEEMEAAVRRLLDESNTR